MILHSLGRRCYSSSTGLVTRSLILNILMARIVILRPLNRSELDGLNHQAGVESVLRLKELIIWLVLLKVMDAVG